MPASSYGGILYLDIESGYGTGTVIAQALADSDGDRGVVKAMIRK